LSHSASFESCDKNAPSKLGTKHLEAESFDEASNIASRILIDNREVQGFRLESAPLKVQHLSSDFAATCENCFKRDAVIKSNTDMPLCEQCADELEARHEVANA
jgi:hypothetical protein